MAGGYKDFAVGEILTSADVDNYLMRQTMMVFASAAARDAALSGVLVEGMVTYQTDTNNITYYTGAAWRVIYLPQTSWTPTFTNLTVGNGTLSGAYTRTGDLVHASFELTWGTTTSIGGTPVSVNNLPITGDATPPSIGSALWTDLGTTTFVGVLLQSSASAFALHSNAGAVAATVPHTWASTDVMRGTITYRAA